MGKSKQSKTLAEKVLEQKGISFQIYLYNSQERDAVKVASLIGVSPARLFKTLVATREGGRPILALIPAAATLNLKRLAAVMGEKRVKMASQAEAEALTRLKAGGISPLALLNGKFEMVIDASCRQWDSIVISAGQKGVNLEIAVADLLPLIDPREADIGAKRD